MFLEIRFGVLSARYLPGQTISKAEVGEVYQCRPAAVAEVLGALVHEGYLTRQGRSEFAVRTWGREEVEDLFELRANFEGWAAFRAAERASDAEISLLVALAAEAREATPDDPESLERVVIENLRFHVEVMRMSRIPQIPDMARMVLPNALHRRIVWSQPADDAEQSFRMHQKIASAVAERSASMARLLMREDIYSSREAVLAAIEDLAGREASETVTIVRFAPTFEFEGRLYGQGSPSPTWTSLRTIGRLLGLGPAAGPCDRTHDLANEVLHAHAASDARLARVLAERRIGAALRLVDRLAPEDAEVVTVAARRLERLARHDRVLHPSVATA